MTDAMDLEFLGQDAIVALNKVLSAELHAVNATYVEFLGIREALLHHQNARQRGL